MSAGWPQGGCVQCFQLNPSITTADEQLSQQFKLDSFIVPLISNVQYFTPINGAMLKKKIKITCARSITDENKGIIVSDKSVCAILYIIEPGLGQMRADGLSIKGVRELLSHM
jgi:hypothetical protein